MTVSKINCFVYSILVALITKTAPAHAYLVDGKLCFVQPQTNGAVLENQIASFTPRIGKVNPANLQRADETMISYLRRINEIYKTTFPDSFALHTKVIGQIKTVTNAHVTPILKESYASHYDQYCYIVPLAYTEEANDGSITLVQTPFYNLNSLQSRSAVNWFALVSPPLAEDFLSLDASFKGSPTTDLLVENLYKLGDEMVLSAIEKTCQNPGFSKNSFCQNGTMKKLINPSAFRELAASNAFKYCLEKQGGIIRNQNDFDSCLENEKGKMSFAGQIEKYNGWIFAEIKKGDEGIFNGVFALIVTLPLQPILWTVMYAGQADDRNSMEADLAKIQYPDFVAVRQAVLDQFSEMHAELAQKFWNTKNAPSSLTNRELLYQSSLTQLQRRLVWHSISALIQENIPFGNIELGTDRSMRIKEERRNKAIETTGAQTVWKPAPKATDYLEDSF